MGSRCEPMLGTTVLTPQLIFVYNADSGKWNGYMDMLHKVFSPSTYPCSLCDITYGVFSIRQEWAEFMKAFPYPTRFLHRDEWEQEFHRKDALPAIFLQEGDGIRLWVSPEKLGRLTLEELQRHIIEKSRTLGVH